MKKLLLMSTFLVSTGLFAAGGDRVGNGGDVVVCGEKVELLDIYEAKLKGHTLIKIDETKPINELRHLIQTKLKPFQRLRAEKYLGYLDTFFSESQKLSGIQLNDIDDSGLVAIPAGCSLQQIVIQLADNDIQHDGHRYTINLDLWNKLDGTNQMALVLHEIIYREVIENNSGSSMVVRGMVGQLLREQTDATQLLRLSSKISDIVEFYNSVIKFPKANILFSESTNERDQRIIKLEVSRDNNIVVWLNHEDYYQEPDLRQYLPLPKHITATYVHFDKSNGKLLFTADYPGIETGRMIYPEEPYDWSLDVLLISTKEVFVKKDGDIRLQKGDILNLELRSTNKTAFLKNVRSSIYRETGHRFIGIFDLHTDEYTVISDKKNETRFYLKRGISGFDGYDYTSVIKKGLGQFSCKKYMSDENFYNTTSFHNCRPEGSLFDITVAVGNRKIKFPVTFSNSYGAISFNADGVMPNENNDRYYPLKTLAPVYLGKTSGFIKKDVTLDPGYYSFSFIEDSHVEIYNQTMTYRIYRLNGSVTVTKHK